MEENIEETKNKKKLFKDKKNIAIVILSILLLISITRTSNENESNLTTSADLTSSLVEKEEIIKEKEKQIEKCK